MTLDILLYQHVKHQLRTIHITGIVSVIFFFGLLHYLSRTTSLDLLPAELIVLIMGGLISLSYLSIINYTEGEPKTPLVILFLLNLCTTVLIWTTGVLQSPFIILYAIIIIITAQLYSYRFGLAQVVLALSGFVAIYEATTSYLLPYYTLLVYFNRDILFQPTSVIMVHGLLYAILFIFTVLSTAKAKAVLFRPVAPGSLNSTYQEKIIEQMPLAVMVVDKNLTILSQNPRAQQTFPAQTGKRVSQYLQRPDAYIEQLIKRLIHQHSGENIQWSTAAKKQSAELSASVLPGRHASENTYILFLKELTDR